MTSITVHLIKDGNLLETREISPHEKISKLLENYPFCSLSLYGEKLNHEDSVCETIINNGDDLIVADKSPCEMADENLLVQCLDERILRKYNREILKFYVFPDQSVTDVFVSLLLQIVKGNGECTIKKHDDGIFESSANFPIIADFYKPKFRILGRVELPPVRIWRQTIIPSRQIPDDIMRDSEFFVHNEQRIEDIRYPEISIYTEDVTFHTFFNELLWETGSMVAGSYLLKHLGLIDDPHDIDVFSFDTTFLIRIVEELDDRGIGYNISNDRGEDFNSFRITSREYNKFHINFVQVKRQGYTDILDYICRNFDISPCITAYDGRTLYYNRHVFDKKIDILLDGTRILKYVERGFKIRRILGNVTAKLYEDRQDMDYHELVFVPELAHKVDLNSFRLCLLAVCTKKELIKNVPLQYKEHILKAFCNEYFE